MPPDSAYALPPGALLDAYTPSATPIDPAAAAPIAAGLSTDIAGYKSQYDQAQAARRSRIDESRRIVEEATRNIQAARQGDMNLPLMMAGAALMSPTRTGSFGESMGNALGAAGKSIQADRTEGAQTATQKAALLQEPVKMAETIDASDAAHAATLLQRAQYDKTLLDRGSLAAKAMSPIGKIRADQLAGRITETQAEAMIAKLTNVSQPKTSAELQAFEEWKKAPGNAERTFEDYLRSSASAKAGGKETGTEGAKAAMTLPQLESSTQQSLDVLDQLSGHPGLPYAIGAGSLLPTVPGTKQADFKALRDSLKGQTFMLAFNGLRGGGAITEAEGSKATDALATIQSTQSPEAFKANLKVLRGIIEQGLVNARKRAAMGSKPVQAEGMPKAADGPPGGTHIGNTPGGNRVFKMPDGSTVEEHK